MAVGSGAQANADGSTTTVLPTLRFASGTYDNKGATLTPGQFGTLDFEDETINGGAINAAGGLLKLGSKNGGTVLNRVAVSGPVAFSGTVILPDSLTLDSPSTITGTLVLGNFGQPSTLTVTAAGSLTGTGKIVPQYSGGYAAASFVNQGLINATGQLSFVGSTAFDNQGTLEASSGSNTVLLGNYDGLNINEGSFTDEGTILATNGGAVAVSVAAALPSTAVVRATAGGVVAFRNLSATAGTITADGGGVLLAAANGGTWTNTGTVNVNAGGTLVVGGKETIANLGTVNRAAGSTVQLVGGTLDLGGQTLGAGSAEFAGLQLGQYRAYGYAYGQATLANGTVDAPGLGLVVEDAVLDGVDLTGNLSISAGYQQSASVTLKGGATVYADASKTRLGTISASSGTVTLLGAGGQVGLAQAVTLGAGGVLALGDGSGGAVTATVASGGSVTGRGAIQANNGDNVTLVNNGTVTAANGQLLDVFLPLGNLAGNTLTGGTYAAQGRDGYYGGGGTISVDGNGQQKVVTLNATVQLGGAVGLGDYGLIVPSTFRADGNGPARHADHHRRAGHAGAVARRQLHGGQRGHQQRHHQDLGRRQLHSAHPHQQRRPGGGRRLLLLQPQLRQQRHHQPGGRHAGHADQQGRRHHQGVRPRHRRRRQQRA